MFWSVMSSEIISKGIGVIDDDLLDSLQTLLFGERSLEPRDLHNIEMALRAFITVEELHMVPKVENHTGITRDETDDLNPVGDGIIDYEFVYEPDEVPLLASITEEEASALDGFVETKLGEIFGKSFQTLSAEELDKAVEIIPFRHTPYLGAQEALEANPDVGPINYYLPLEHIQTYATTLVRLSRGGAVVFSETLIGKACYEHIFSRYPQQIFEELDASWSSYLRKVVGPGIGVTIPPVLACVLTRANGKRHQISSCIRDLREEYASSRRALWDHLAQMWMAPTLKKQLKLLDELERASSGLFRASFPERFPFLETAWDITADVAELKPLSAATKLGSAALKHSKFHNQVSAISFTRQLATDLRKVAGLSRLLRPYLDKSEAARLGIR